MPIRVRYFASLKDKVGRSEDELMCPAPLSVRDTWHLLHPDLPLPETILAAVNMEYADLDTLVQDGDELGFFPPVTGG